MLTVNNVLQQGFNRLQDVAATPRLDAELILCHVLAWERIDLITKKQTVLSEDQVSRFNALIEMRLAGKPVQYIIGTQEFMGLPFEVTDKVLIPRPDTETLIETVLQLLKGRKHLRILDVGTGSGAIPIALAHYIEDAKLWSIDISAEASSVAEGNARLNRVDDRITFLVGDLYEPLERLDSPVRFDMVISNPPYIPSKDIDDLQIEVAQFEPRLALDGGVDGLDFYRRLVADALNHLADGGIMAFEIGYDQGQAVSELLKQKGFVDVEVIQDLAGKDRVVIGRLS